MANSPFVFPAVIAQLLPAIESPVVATVMIAVPVPVPSLTDPVWLSVIAISTSVTVAVTVIVSVLSPSDTWTTTTHVLALFPAPQPGVSKSGAEENVRAPLAELIENKSWSTEAALSPTATIEYVWVAVPSVSVAV